MDWNPKSDPYWSGVSDKDEPNRVLDVKALTGSTDVKVWLFRDSFSVGGKRHAGAPTAWMCSELAGTPAKSPLGSMACPARSVRRHSTKAAWTS